MQKVITITLDSRLFQLDQRGYNSLATYLEHAEAQLGTNPDRAEIIRDLELSIAEKFSALVEPGKPVVASGDVNQVLRDIGPVDGGVSGWSADSESDVPGSISPPRRLYKIREGAMVSGLCSGIAAYFKLDPTFVRIGFVGSALLEIATFDRPPAVVIGLYAILVFIVPHAAALPDAGAPGRPGSIVDKMLDRVARVRGALFGGA